MTVLIGTDEAGYGPNLGPLVIAATTWHCADVPAEVDLYKHLMRVVSRKPDDARRLPIADSKVLYSPGVGLCRLETSVFATLLALRHSIQTWREVWSILAPELDRTIFALPWHCTYDEPLPVACPREEAELRARKLGAGLAAANTELLRVEADAIFPCEFNRLVEEQGSKGAVLSIRTLELARRAVQSTDDPLTIVHCDKHGGRNTYMPLLQPLFPDYLVEVVRESRDLSVYRWGPPQRRVEFRFSVRGESFLPTALASMFAKYLRELGMRAFNAFWQAHHADLRPTAGYAVDARRFYADIADKQRELAIASHLMWRTR